MKYYVFTGNCLRGRPGTFLLVHICGNLVAITIFYSKGSSKGMSESTLLDSIDGLVWFVYGAPSRDGDVAGGASSGFASSALLLEVLPEV